MTLSAATLAKSTGSRFRAVAWVVLLAFTLQSFITQTHIHGIFGGGGAATVSTVTNGSPHSKDPSQDNARYCPFCQAITHAGAFAAPSAPSLILPISWAEMVALPVLAIAIRSIWSHPWHSRAPPQR